MTVYELLNPQKEYLKSKKAFIFDMDGTLIDSMQYWWGLAGDDKSKYASHREYMIEKYDTVIEPKKHAVEFLTLLRENGIPLCIATDTPKQMSEGFFKRHPYFSNLVDFHIDSIDAGDSKHNSAKIYELAAEKLGFKKEECLVVEDNKHAVIMAANAGFDVIAVFDEANAGNAEIIKEYCIDYINDFSQLMKKMTKLIFPSLKHRENAIDFINEFHEFGSQINGTADLDEYIKNNNYEAWLNKVEDFRGRKNIPADRVPALTYFYIREEDQKIVGMVDIRLELNDFLRKEGGHIGYCVRPTERNKHYATNMLKEALKILNDQGINKAVITCASDNKASIAVIENCGGVLEAEFLSKTYGEMIKKYTINGR